MAVVVGKLVEHNKTVSGAPQHKIILVLLRMFYIIANEAVLFFTQTLNISNPPRRPEIVSFQFGLPTNYLIGPKSSLWSD